MKSIIISLFINFFSITLVFSQTSERKFVSINDKQMAYKIFGLDERKANEPIVIFESGLGSGGGSYESLFPFIQKSFAGIVYDRNGIGESEIDTSIKKDEDVIKRLHDMLVALKINPPYLLVGHSIGGPFIRLYASMYPNEICGLFFIDPTDFMLTEDEDNKVKINTSSSTGYRELFVINLKNIINDTSTSDGFRNEAKRELNESSPEFFKNYKSLSPLKDIPVTVMISYNKHIEHYETEMNGNLKLGINLIPWWKELDELRINHYAEMIKNNSNSRLILLPRYSHGIHQQDPKSVAEALMYTYKNCLTSLKSK
ncbi:alpha/beta fold hydrolase [Chryseobacterium lathyri]|uniref:alpha/beta fold hydrolase n=1 Tax=Chryseobacterium lathyri TaxID=395933 RepID=UPI002786B888|nr:alpha/beta fold hydrolase [Chryseobacterium lathyri]MDQ0065647.1 pimeloyl-ACP methyl ester carboxylesterase [Chryseobacterium lathyri]